MDDLAVALQLADRADDLTMNAFQRAPAWRTKPDGSQVSDVDVEVDGLMRERLRVIRPTDAVLSEEFGPSDRVSDRTWIIDPLDQTSNYLRGLTEFATLIALTVGTRVIVAVVSAPALGHRWWSVSGGGAWRDAKPIRVSGIRTTTAALISVAAPHIWQRRGKLSGVVRLLESSRGGHGSGGFLAQMLVAEGRLDIALDPWGDVWDLAACSLIVQEAGGAFTDTRGKSDIYAGSGIATNGHLHTEVLATINHPDRD